MSDTPETDAEKYQCPHTLKFIVEASHAEDLERERNEAIQARKDSAKDWLNQISNTELKVTRIKRENDELRSIFPKILESLESGGCSEDCSVEFFSEIPKEVRLVRQKLERELDMWKSRADGYEQDYHEILKRLDEVVKEHDEIKEECRRYIALWDRATKDLEIARFGIECKSELHNELIKSAEAVIERWESPSWKETLPTALHLNKLRNAVEAVKGGA